MADSSSSNAGNVGGMVGGGTAPGGSINRKRGIKGVWRVYFNMRSEYPRVFSIDDGTSEHEDTFTRVLIIAPSQMRYDVTHGQPVCWLEVRGELIHDERTATII